MSSCPGTNSLVTVPSAQITVTFVFQSFFSSLARSRYLSLFSLSFRFTLWSAGTAMSTIQQVLFFIDYHWLIGLVGRVFANGPEDLGSIPGRVIPKALKMVLDTALLNTQQYKVQPRVKWSNPRKRVAPSPTPRCNSY